MPARLFATSKRSARPAPAPHVGNHFVKTFAQVLLALLALASPVAFAQDAANGQALYASNCSVCHGPASANAFAVLAGANPAVIRTEILIYAPMRFLAPNPNGPITADSQIVDIAAYLAQVANPGTGNRDPVFAAAPPAVDFGTVSIGDMSGTQTIAIANSGASGTIGAVSSSNAAEFPIVGGSCNPLPMSVAQNASCTVLVQFVPAAAGSRAATLDVINSGATNPVSVPLAGNGASISGGGGPGAKVSVIEYFNAALNHYFITPNAVEIALLGKPPFEAWQPTGLAFSAYAPAGAPAGTVGVCRFFNDHFLGVSTHFYAPHGLGCEQTLAQFPDWSLEDPQLFNASLPDAATGNCPSGQVPVYRLFNNGMGGAPNHRFTVDPAVRQQMVDRGYTPEGAGIGVGWCAPQ